MTKATSALAWEVWPLGFAGQEKEQGRAGLLSTVHALEFGPRGRGWSSFPFPAGSHLEWVALGTLVDRCPWNHPCLLHKMCSASGGAEAVGGLRVLLDPVSGIPSLWFLEVP